MHYKGPRRKDKEPEKLFEEIVAENFPKLMKETYTQVHDTRGVLSMMNPKRNKSRHILKVKDKDRILKGARDK